MRKSIFIVLVLTCKLLLAQTASEKACEQTCNCIKKIDSKLPPAKRKELAMKCMENASINHFEGMMAQYKIKEKNLEKAANKVGEKFGAELATSCPDIIPFFMEEAGEDAGEDAAGDINPDTLVLKEGVCALFKTGKYGSQQMYINKKYVESPDKSSYSEVVGSTIIDYSNNKKTITKWTIKWLSACEWEQILIESNDPETSKLIKKGDKITLKAIGSSGNDLWVSSKMFGMDVLVLLRKQ
ncbi:MAG: hypothetical protein MUF42_02910 [Cytophagaceae bacterium]|nr:hypothetical protein [Cytophagaceae bacterium]